MSDPATQRRETEHWVCGECGEEHANMESKVPGGCLSCVDILRYIEYEAPGMGMIHNDVAAVVCDNDPCNETVSVDPNTLVIEDESAVDIESEEMDMETGEKTGYTRVEIYCSPQCRNEAYTWDDPPDSEELPGDLSRAE